MNITRDAPEPTGGVTDRQRIAWLLGLLGVLATSFVLSSLASPLVSGDVLVDFTVKKTGHFTGYAVLGGVLAMTLAAWRDRLRLVDRVIRLAGGPTLIAILLAGLWALSDEFHQSLRPDRTPLVADVLLDTAGATVGALLAVRFVAPRLGWRGRMGR